MDRATKVASLKLGVTQTRITELQKTLFNDRLSRELFFFSLLLAGWKIKSRESLSYRKDSMRVFLFCCCDAFADLRVKDTGSQQFYLANRPPPVQHSSPLLVPWMTKCLLVPFIPLLKWTGQMLHSWCLMQDKRLYLAVLVSRGHKCFRGSFEAGFATGASATSKPEWK